MFNVGFVGRGNGNVVAPSLWDSGVCWAIAFPTLKRGANKQRAYGAAPLSQNTRKDGHGHIASGGMDAASTAGLPRQETTIVSLGPRSGDWRYNYADVPISGLVGAVGARMRGLPLGNAILNFR